MGEAIAEKTQQKFNFTQNADLKEALLDWHKNLEENKRDRAVLRRLDDPRDALLTRTFATFETMLVKHSDRAGFGRQERFQLALIAALLAHVRSRGQRKFAEALAKDEVAELRFQRLFITSNADDPDHLVYRFDALRRLIALCKEPFDIAAFAQDLYRWHYDDQKNEKRVQMEWCQDFFSLPKKK